MNAKTTELFETITASIVKTIETGNAGKWTKPWTQVLAAAGSPVNASTKKHYQGMNVLIAMVEAAVNGYASGYWATYKQWEGLGAQVRKGEKGTKLIKWGFTYKCQDCKHKGMKPCESHLLNRQERFGWASTFTVFNADQVDGWAIPEAVALTEVERLENVEAFIQATGATIVHQWGDSAHFTPALDTITLPMPEQFATQQGYYGTALHELSHWAGGPSRLARETGSRFGDDKYAAEELVAELGATFLAAHFGIEAEPHMEHAAYLGSWLRALKADAMALYRAAKLASEATEYLLGLADTKASEAPQAA
jgi:antirestriction protein ArdC